MEWILDPTALAGLATLIVLEVVLGIDNLVFIAILSEKLPPDKRYKANVIGLSLALIMRLALLSVMGWVITLNTPLFTLFGFDLGVRQLIMLLGGFFLLFKATTELNERLEGKQSHHQKNKPKKTAKFWPVIAQIVVLDAVFSIDSIITAVGMSQHKPVMMLAVIIAMIVMIVASKTLTRFVNAHPTIVILCLSFLLMIGFSLIADGLGFHIPKGYLYAAIGFSILIEFFNQVANANREKSLSSKKTLRQRTTDAVLNLLDGPSAEQLDNTISESASEGATENSVFNAQERQMIERVLGLSQRTLGSIMTSRQAIVSLNLSASKEATISKLKTNPYSRMMITRMEAEDEPIGTVEMGDILKQILDEQSINLEPLVKQPLIFPETASLLVALEQFKQAKSHFAFVVDEFGSLQGIVTVNDIIETITGDLPLEGERIDARYDIQHNENGCWIVNGLMPVDDLIHHIDIPLEEKREYHTVAGLLMEHSEHMLLVDEIVMIGEWQFKVLSIEANRVAQVQIEHLAPNDQRTSADQ